MHRQYVVPMIKSFEPVYKELEYLFIQKLPKYIDKINKEHNDGIILKPFTNTKLAEECIKLPCFKFSFDEAEYTEKDRIIESTVYNFSLELNLQPYADDNIILFNRYLQAIEMAIKENELDCIECKILETRNNKIYIRAVL